MLVARLAVAGSLGRSSLGLGMRADSSRRRWRTRRIQLACGAESVRFELSALSVGVRSKRRVVDARKGRGGGASPRLAERLQTVLVGVSQVTSPTQVTAL